jgi:hypothetical protein
MTSAAASIGLWEPDLAAPSSRGEPHQQVGVHMLWKPLGSVARDRAGRLGFPEAPGESGSFACGSISARAGTCGTSARRRTFGDRWRS